MAKHPLLRRQAAVEATMRRFQTSRFNPGKGDCFQMEKFLLQKLGIKIPGLKDFKYKDLLTGRQKLKEKFGVKTVVEFNDKFFDRIPVAAALPGDIIAAPEVGDYALGAVMIPVGNDLAMLYVEDHDTPVIGRITYAEGAEPIAAWRTLP
jgi:hypothetical protein